MKSLARTTSGPGLDVWTGAPGIVADPVLLQYVVDDISTPAKFESPTRVYPSSGRATVDLVADKIDTGHYRAAGFAAFLATYTGSGRHRVTWYFQCTYGAIKPPTGWIIYDPNAPSDATVMPEVSYTEEFDVIAGTMPAWGYCLPSDLRDEGLDATLDASDRRLVTSIALATKKIENATGRFFEPRQRILQLDGHGERAMLLDDPIIWLKLIELSPLFNDVPLEINEVDVRVYNRHIFQGMNQPDDRNDPRVELLRLGIWTTVWTTNNPPISAFVAWPIGVQNIGFKGVFGYTDRDQFGISPVGEIPLLIRHAAKLIVMREYAQMVDYDTREDRQHRHRIVSEGGRSHSIHYKAQPFGSYTGDPDIDTILEGFRRPIYVGAA